MMIGRIPAVCLGAAALRFSSASLHRLSAGPGVVATPQAGTALVQEAGYYKRRWRYRDDAYSGRETFVAAPFAQVYSGRYGTWVRAPFVNLWVPR